VCRTYLTYIPKHIPCIHAFCNSEIVGYCRLLTMKDTVLALLNRSENLHHKTLVLYEDIFVKDSQYSRKYYMFVYILLLSQACTTYTVTRSYSNSALSLTYVIHIRSNFKTWMLFIKITKQRAFNSTITVICLEQHATQSQFSEIKKRRTGDLRLFF